MKRKLLITLTAVVALLLAGALAGCKKLEARDNLNKGVQAFKNAKYADAVEFFQKAIDLDPTYPTARVYLATAYVSQYIPGAESPENVAYAQKAEENFKIVLQENPKDTGALKALASLAFQQANGAPTTEEKMKRLDKAAGWYQKLADTDPNEREAFYSLGVIAWAKFYPAWMAARNKLNMSADAPGPLKDKKVRAELEAEYGEVIGKGMKSLERALEIDKEYDEAMAYLNLLYRERADLSADEAGYKKDTEAADQWMTKTLETRKIKAERAPQNKGISNEPAKK
jgi:tetratricopeptide (TPR) repeat protein